MKINTRRKHILNRAVEFVLNSYNSHVSIYDMSCGFGAMRFGVNWGAIGTVDAQTTREFAEKLIRAAEIAEELNKFELEEVYESDKAIEDRDAFMRAVKNVVKCIEANQWETVRYFVELGNQ